MSLVTVCMASVLVVLVAIKLKKMNAEYSTLLSIGACLFIVSFIIGRLGNVLDSIDRITGYININMEYISILLKMLGISYTVNLRQISVRMQAMERSLRILSLPDG